MASESTATIQNVPSTAKSDPNPMPHKDDAPKTSSDCVHDKDDLEDADIQLRVFSHTTHSNKIQFPNSCKAPLDGNAKPHHLTNLHCNSSSSEIVDEIAKIVANCTDKTPMIINKDALPNDAFLFIRDDQQRGKVVDAPTCQVTPLCDSPMWQNTLLNSAHVEFDDELGLDLVQLAQLHLKTIAPIIKLPALPKITKEAPDDGSQLTLESQETATLFVDHALLMIVIVTLLGPTKETRDEITNMTTDKYNPMQKIEDAFMILPPPSKAGSPYPFRLFEQ